MQATIATPEGGAPGTALIEVFDAPPFEGEPRFSILSSQGHLSADGWQESRTFLAPEAWDNDSGRLRLAVGAAVVDQLDPLETYRFVMGDQSCSLQAGDLLFSDMGGGQGMGEQAPPAADAEKETPPAPEAPAPETPEETPAPEAPAPDQPARETPVEGEKAAEKTEEAPAPQEAPVAESPSAPPPVEKLSMTPETPPAKAAAPLVMEPAAPKGKSRLPLLLLLALLLAGGVLAYGYLARDAQNAATAPLPELPKPENPAPAAQEPAPEARKTPEKTDAPKPAPAPEKAAPQTPPPATPAPEAAAGAHALSEARELLRRNAAPEETLAAGKALRTPDADARQSDAAFLLLEDAAQKGNAEAVFLVARFYDPASDLPRGSIPPDLAQARSWYEAARDKGHAESAQALSALRTFAEEKARQGDEEARLLLQTWK